VAALTVRVAVPDPPGMLWGEIETVKPEEPAADNDSVPANWFIGVIVMVEMTEAPAFG
jgi:hypothetical protein